MFKTIAIVYLAIVGFMSVVSFLFYGWDKRQARRRGQRVPENRLHLLAILGGWPGAMLGQSYFRHKTQKFGFQAITWLAAAIHAIAVAIFLYFMFLPSPQKLQVDRTATSAYDVTSRVQTIGGTVLQSSSRSGDDLTDILNGNVSLTIFHAAYSQVLD